MDCENLESAVTMTVLMVEPCEKPHEFTVGSDLQSLQQAVNGNIEVTYPFDDDVGLIMNEEGKLIGMPLNRALRDDNGEIYDIIAGPFMVAGLTEDNFCSLTAEQMQKYSDIFRRPETFIKMGRSIMAIPVPDEITDVKSVKEDVKSARVNPKKGEPER